MLLMKTFIFMGMEIQSRVKKVDLTLRVKVQTTFKVPLIK